MFDSPRNILFLGGCTPEQVKHERELYPFV